MIKNEKRTEKQEKKFIKKLRKLGFKKAGNVFNKVVDSFEFVYFIAGFAYGDFDFYGENPDRHCHKYPTIEQVLSLIKEHTGKDLSHRLKKNKYEKLEDRVKALEERLEPVVLEVTYGMTQSGYGVKPTERITKNVTKFGNPLEPKEEEYKFGDVVEIVEDNGLSQFQNGDKVRFIYRLPRGGGLYPILVVDTENLTCEHVNPSQIKKV